MAKNQKLIDAKKAKRDMFFTYYETAEDELKCYDKELFKNKVVYCNCDTDKSNFYKYFVNHFEDLGLKKLIVTGIAGDWDYFNGTNVNKAFKVEYYGKEKETIITELKGDNVA